MPKPPGATPPPPPPPRRKDEPDRGKSVAPPTPAAAPIPPGPKPPAASRVKRRVLGCFATLFASSGLVAAAAAAVVVLGIVAIVAAYQYFIVANPGEQFEPAHIRQIIAQDSPVFYRDGTTRIGVFFEDEHRDTLSWDEIPKPFVVALIAAEDGDYWTHWGLSPKHIVRAMVGNVLAGGVTSGGSTLTQQTAKNLFYRPDRSLKSKVSELTNALKLEAHFDKQEILGFYINQFHVTGNGRGLGIAARHFFDTDASKLDLVQCAYLAGLVKGPSNYDPFASSDPAKQKRARERADERVRYVLRRIVEEDEAALAGPMDVEMVRKTKAEAQKLLDEGFTIPFREGVFRYDTNILIDEIANRLAEAPFPDVLKAAGISDPGSAGLQVITTLDPNVQREATYGLWHHLTEVGTQLEALDAKAYVLAEKAPGHEDEALIAHELHVGTVARHVGANGKRSLEVAIGPRTCPVDRDGVTRVALMIYRGLRKDKNARVSAAFVDQVAEAIPDGAAVLVSLRTVGSDGPICDLELRPKLQGGAVVLQDGAVRAMVGGNDNRNFNRAFALRQLGSTWKPLVYHAALQLGWSPTDILDNRRNLFHFSTVDYWPTSDHVPAPRVGLAWAGVNSENLASVWLFYHLTDRLDARATAALADAVGLTRQADETEAAWHERLVKAGVNPKHRVDEARYLRARSAVLAELPTSPHPEDADTLLSMVYGSGFEAEKKRVLAARDDDMDEKLDALNRSYLSVHERAAECEDAAKAVADAMSGGNVREAKNVEQLWVRRDGDALDFACGDTAPDGYSRMTRSDLKAFVKDVEPEPAAEPEPEPDEPDPVEKKPKKRGLFGGKKPPKNEGRPKPKPKPPGKWSTDVPTYDARPMGAADDVLIDGNLHLSTLRRLDDAMQENGPTDPWSPEVLFWTQDFRLLLAMRYVEALAHDLGVESELKDSLTLPLGASEITIEEATMMYDGVTSGRTWDFPGVAAGTRVPEPDAGTLLISEIRDVDGNVLYRAEPTRRDVTEPLGAQMTADILQNVVKYGTGKRADGVVKDGGSAVPLGGKTGTTNEYRNAAFVGFVPKAKGSRYVREGGVTIGVYVGYDDNHPMEAGNIKLAGANGALPAWIWAAQGVVSAGLVGHPSGKGPWTLDTDAKLSRVGVDGATGLPGNGASVLALPERAVPAEPTVPRGPKKLKPTRGKDVATAPKGNRRKGIWK